MSQHDFNIANQTFPSFRADLNNALVAAATMSAGASAPTTPYPYQLWFDTTTGTWKVRNSGNTAWISTITTDLATGSVNISNSSGATLKLTSTDTSGADTELLGQIDFVSSDVSSGAAGTQARIKGVYEDNGDSSGLAFLTGASTGSGSPTLNEVMRIRHEGRVGIGTNSPSTVLDVEGSNINFASSENGILNVFSNDAAANDKGGSISLGGNSNSGAFGFALIKGAKEGTDSGYLAFGTRTAAAYSTERMRITSSGAVIINNSGGDAQLYMGGDSGTNRMYLARSGANSSLWNASNGAVIFGTNNAEAMRILSTGGITFNGDTSTNNALDDYEEGAWTATFAGSTTTATGYYTKVGNTVFFMVYGSALNVTSSTSATISGLPFTNNGGYTAASITHDTYTNNSYNGYVASGGAAIYPIQDGTISSAQTSVGSTKYIMVSGTYITNS